MSLIKVDVISVRNINKLTIEPSPAINFICGPNGSGKSALLEAIFILGRAKSFRLASIKPVIQIGQECLVVSALKQQTSGNLNQLGVSLNGKSMEIRINQQNEQLKSTLAYILPLQIIYPKSYELLDAGSSFRREFLDWGVFNEFTEFLPAWRKFKKALSQRNSYLKTKAITQINVWNKELVYYGTIVNDFRKLYLERFTPIFNEILTWFLSAYSFEINFIPGWDMQKPFQQVLLDDIEKDLRYGFTHSGPHRADFQLLINNQLAKDFVSRGQLKLIIISLKLAQIQLLNQRDNNSASILIDDLIAELDQDNRAKLLAFLDSLKCQVFITTTDISEMGNLCQLEHFKMFHMEHGEIKQK